MSDWSNVYSSAYLPIPGGVPPTVAQGQAEMAYNANLQQQQQAISQQNQQAIANAAPTPPGYGQVAPYPSFGEPSGPGSVSDPYTVGPYHSPGELPTSIPGANYPSSYIQQAYEHYGALPSAAEWPSYVSLYGDPGQAASVPLQDIRYDIPTSIPGANYPTSYIQQHLEHYGSLPTAAEWPSYVALYGDPGATSSYAEQPASSGYNTQQSLNYGLAPTSIPGTNYPESYIQQHIAAYGYAPTAEGWPSYVALYGDPGQQSSYAEQPASSGYNTQQSLNYPTSIPGTNYPESYIQQHIAAYGYAPTAEGWPGYVALYGNPGPQSSVFQTGAPEIPNLNAGAYMDAFRAQQIYDNMQQLLQETPNIYTPSVQSYVQQHEDRYGYDPSLEFFAPGGGWDQMYGGGVTGSAFNNAYAQAPPDQTTGAGRGATQPPPPFTFTPPEGDLNAYSTFRAPYAAQMTPAQAYDMAVRMSLEASDSQTRQAIAEAMTNRWAARGLSPLDPGYYPKDADYATKYANATRDLRNNPTLLNQIYNEMNLAFGGSNVSGGATDWASDQPGNPVATNALKYATGTWLSPSGEQFYRKDISNPQTGAGAAQQIQDWWNQVQNWQAP